jgi:transposase
MSKKLQLTSGSEEEVLNLYVRQRMSIKRTSKISGVSYHSIRKILEAHNVHIRGSDYSRASNPPPSTRLDLSQYQSLLIELESGGRHAPLGRKYGISRERVRQIAQREGMTAGRVLQRRDAQIRRDKEEAKKALSRRMRELNSEDARNRMSALWMAGKSMEEIGVELAAILGRDTPITPGVIGSALARYRTRWPSLFPYRYAQATHNRRKPPKPTERKCQRESKAKTASKRKKIKDRLRRFWAKGYSAPKIAKRMGFTVIQVYIAISRARALDPESFPYRIKQPEPDTPVLHPRTEIEDVSTGEA